MIKCSNYAAVIFDLDGLVLDTEGTYFEAWQKAASDMGYAPVYPLLQTLSGLQAAEIKKHLLATFGVNFDLPRFTALSSHYWHELVEQQGIAIKPGFEPLIEQLQTKKIPFALATNSPHSNALACLALAGLVDTFDIVIACDHVQNGKPAPDIFLKAAQALCVPIEQCLVLEDSYTGVLSASRAGASIVYIPSTEIDPLATALATCQLESLTHLSQY